MLMQYLKSEGFQEGLYVLFEEKFGTNALNLIQTKIREITDTEKLKALMKAVARAASPQEVLNFIEAEKLV